MQGGPAVAETVRLGTHLGLKRCDVFPAYVFSVFLIGSIPNVGGPTWKRETHILFWNFVSGTI